MSSASFQVIFDGNLNSGLPNHEIDVKQLSAALAALGALFESADNCLNEGRTGHTLKVKGSFKTGFFKIDFVSWQNIIQKTKDLLSNQKVVTPESILTYLIFSGGLIGLIKWLKGQKPTKIVDMENGRYKVYRGDKYYEAEKKVLQLYQDYNVRKATECAISETLDENKISKIAFTKDEGKTFQSIDFSEKEYFFAPPESKTVIDEKTFETNIHLIRLSFKKGNKWTVDDGNSQYSVIVEDEDYLLKIEKNEIDFSKGDLLKVRIRYIQYLTESGLKKEYFIEKVLEHSNGVFKGEAKYSN